MPVARGSKTGAVHKGKDPMVRPATLLRPPSYAGRVRCAAGHARVREPQDEHDERCDEHDDCHADDGRGQLAQAEAASAHCDLYGNAGARPAHGQAQRRYHHRGHAAAGDDEHAHRLQRRRPDASGQRASDPHPRSGRRRRRALVLAVGPRRPAAAEKAQAGACRRRGPVLGPQEAAHRQRPRQALAHGLGRSNRGRKRLPWRSNCGLRRLTSPSQRPRSCTRSSKDRHLTTTRKATTSSRQTISSTSDVSLYCNRPRSALTLHAQIGR